MVKLYKLGDTSKAICTHCGQIQPTTFRERNVPLSSGRGVVHDVLVGVCDVCGEVVSVPQQSVPRINESVRLARHSVEARLPRHLLDALGLACHELGFGMDSSPVAFRYYLRRVASQAKLRSRITALARSDEAIGRASARFSTKLNDAAFELLRSLEGNGVTRSDVVKALIIQLKRDVLDDKREDICRELQSAMQYAG